MKILKAMDRQALKHIREYVWWQHFRCTVGEQHHLQRPCVLFLLSTEGGGGRVAVQRHETSGTIHHPVLMEIAPGPLVNTDSPTLLEKILEARLVSSRSAESRDKSRGEHGSGPHRQGV